MDIKPGAHLRVARSWAQRKKRNGSTVTWSSNDVLQPPVTIGELEEVAQEVANAIRQNYFILVVSKGGLIELASVYLSFHPAVVAAQQYFDAFDGEMDDIKIFDSSGKVIWLHYSN